MSIEMSQFYQVFFEEASEHLTSMENLLLALDLSAPDQDQLNAIFRAAHSIKGGSGTFGFSDMTEVTHVLETLLDRIRKSEINITSEMVDAFLEAGDVLSDLLEAHQQGILAGDAPSIAICEKLERLVARGSASPVPAPKVAEASSSLAYRIEFQKNPQNFQNEASFDNLLEDLRRLGSLENLSIENGRVNMTLVTAAKESELRELFAFFLEPSDLDIIDPARISLHAA